MRLPAVRRSLIAILVSVLIAVLYASAAQAGPAPGLCTPSSARGTVPDSFPVEACISTNAVRLRNDLSVPVEIVISGGLGAMSVAQIDQNPAAITARSIINQDAVLLPGDLATIPLAATGGRVRIAGTTGGDTYILAETLAAFIPVGGVAKNGVDALTGLVSDLADSAMAARNCRAGQNWIVQSACDLAYNTTVVLQVGKAVLKGVLSGPLGLIASTVEWMKLVDEQVPSVEKVLKGERTLSITGPLPSRVSTPTSSPAASPWPTRDSEGPPALYAWLGAGFYAMPKWVSCTIEYCIVDQGSTVLVVKQAGLVKLGLVPSSVREPAGQLVLLGLDAAAAKAVLAPGQP